MAKKVAKVFDLGTGIRLSSNGVETLLHKGDIYIHPEQANSNLNPNDFIVIDWELGAPRPRNRRKK